MAIGAVYVTVRDGQVAHRPLYAAIGVDVAGHTLCSDRGPLPAGGVGEVLAAGAHRAEEPRDQDVFFVVCDGLKGVAGLRDRSAVAQHLGAVRAGPGLRDSRNALCCARPMGSRA